MIAAKCKCGDAHFATLSACRAGCRCGCSPIIQPTIRAASRPAFSTVCLLGCGDAVIGINPATDSPERAHACCRCSKRFGEARHPDPKLRAGACHDDTRSDRKGSPVDLVFQSIAGTEAANKSFGIDLALLEEAREAALSLRRGTSATMSCISRPARAAPFRQRASRRRPADARGARLCGGAGVQAASGQHRRRFYRTGISVRRKQITAPDWRTIFAASSWACRWASISVTPIMPTPIRTTWTHCSRCWSQRASIS